MKSKPGRQLRTLCAMWLIATLVLGVILLLRNVNSVDPSTAKTATAALHSVDGSMRLTSRPSVLVVGDDFAAGYGGIPRNAYPYILCNVAGLNCNVDAQVGSGFLNNGRADGSGTGRLIGRLADDFQRYVVDFLIIDAGRNDVRASSALLAGALDAYLTRVGQFWPAAKIFVIGPANLSATPRPDYDLQLDAMSEVVDRHDGVLVDPVAAGWYRDVDITAIRAENGHYPTQQGHQLIAHRLVDVLVSNGIVEWDTAG